jgi:hypothetical protein
MRRVHAFATVIWSVLAAGAGFGFVARDLFSLPAAAVAFAWACGALAGLALTRRRPPV